jgi:hypothetical protein
VLEYLKCTLGVAFEERSFSALQPQASCVLTVRFTCEGDFDLFLSDTKENLIFTGVFSVFRKIKEDKFRN